MGRGHLDGVPAAAEHVVVGAGITGAAIASHLARLGASPLILEAGEPACGATGASGGMVRAYDPDPVVARLAEASLHAYADAAAWVSGVAPLRRTGAITLAAAKESAELEYAAQALRSAVGDGPRVVVGADEVLGVRTAGGVAFVEPNGGWVSAVEVTNQFLRQAIRDGGRLVTGTRLRALRRAGDGVLLETQHDTVHARAVVLALGGWAAVPPRGVQPHMRVRTRAIQVSLLRRPTGARAHAVFIDLRTGGYGKPVDEHTSLIGIPLWVWDESPAARPEPDMGHHRQTLDVVRGNLPWVTHTYAVHVVRSFDGYAGGSKLLVPTDIPGVWLARVGSGGGVKVAPQLGREIAEWLLGTAPETPFGPSSHLCASTVLPSFEPLQAKRGTNARLL
jgi:glycine/D-amino acid oxidase-like deaminating enzyme